MADVPASKATKTVLISGANGDTGRPAARESIALGLTVRALVHTVDDRAQALADLGAEVVEGDLLDINTVRPAMEGVDAAYFVWPVQPGLLHAIVNFAQVPYLQSGVLRMPVGKGRHSPIAADDQGRAIAALLLNPEGHVGTTVPLSGPIEMDHEQMAAELSTALGRTSSFHDLPVAEYVESLRAMGVPPYVVQHLSGAMVDYQNGHMSGADNNIEQLTGRRPMTVGEFARAHAELLNGVSAN